MATQVQGFLQAQLIVISLPSVSLKEPLEPGEMEPGEEEGRDREELRLSSADYKFNDARMNS